MVTRYSSPAHRSGGDCDSFPGQARGSVQSWNRHAQRRPQERPISGCAIKWWTSCQSALFTSESSLCRRTASIAGWRAVRTAPPSWPRRWYTPVRHKRGRSFHPGLSASGRSGERALHELSVLASFRWFGPGL